VPDAVPSPWAVREPYTSQMEDYAVSGQRRRIGVRWKPRLLPGEEASTKRAIDLQIIGGDYSRSDEISPENEDYLKKLIELG
jgi:hypothetical protein